MTEHRHQGEGHAAVRAEARPFAFAKLSAEERAALRSLLEFLSRRLPGPPRRRDPAEEIDLDFERSAGVHVLAGYRGTGKTSVLLSLRWATRHPSEFLEGVGDIESQGLADLQASEASIANAYAKIAGIQQEHARHEDMSWRGKSKRAALARAKQELGRLGDERDRLSKALEDAKEAHKKTSADREVARRRHARDAEQIEKAKRDLQSVEARARELDVQRHRRDEELGTRRRDLALFETRAAELRVELSKATTDAQEARLREVSRQIEQEVASRQASIAQLEGLSRDVAAAIGAHDEQGKQIESQAAKRREELDTAERSLRERIEKENQDERRVRDLAQSLTKLEGQVKRTKERTTRLKNELALARKEESAARKEPKQPEDLKKELAGAEAEANAARTNLEQVRLCHEAQQVERLIGKVAPHIVWLETLDLEPLPEGTNLLVAMLVRLREAFARELKPASARDGHGGASADRHGPCGADQLASRPSGWAILSRFISDVAISGNGNLDARGANLDPDSYAHEASRAELARMRLASMGQILEDLAGALMRALPGRPSPLFVLPVDDADLLPSRVRELVRLLRLISFGRIVTLVLADPDDPERIMEDVYYGELAALRGQGEWAAPVGAAERTELQQRAAVLAARSLRKLLPPAQKTDLRLLEPEEAWRLRPPDERETLGKLLGDIPLPGAPFIEGEPRDPRIGTYFRAYAAPLRSLADLFDLARHLGEHRPVFTEAGAGILRAPYRVLLDLWHQARELRARKPVVGAHASAKELAELHRGWQRALLRFLGSAFRRAVNESPLGAAARRVVRDLWDGIGLELDVTKIEARSAMAGDIFGPGDGLLRFHNHHAVFLRIPRTTGNRRPERAGGDRKRAHWDRIEDSTVVGWFQVLHDVAKMCAFPVLIGESATNKLSVAGLAGLRAGGPVGELLWTTPDWDTFVDFDLFFRAWNAALTGVVASLDAVEETQRAGLAPSFAASLACRWIAIATGISSKERRPPGQRGQEPHLLPWLAGADAFVRAAALDPEALDDLVGWVVEQLDGSWKDMPVLGRAADAKVTVHAFQHPARQAAASASAPGGPGRNVLLYVRTRAEDVSRDRGRLGEPSLQAPQCVNAYMRRHGDEYLPQC
ncbi:MAG: hypothetical protein HY744_31860 [Deltaproteobacteria bacterium]|nr:hypothetical protein [Deltaproteobacteria bacterium]